MIYESRGNSMSTEKRITLILDMDNERDQKINNDSMAYAKKNAITDESEALKSFMMHLHFLGADMNKLSNKIKDLC